MSAAQNPLAVPLVATLHKLRAAQLDSMAYRAVLMAALHLLAQTTRERDAARRRVSDLYGRLKATRETAA